MTIETLIKKAQEAMNKVGAQLKVDGKWGPKTTSAADKYQFRIDAFFDLISPQTLVTDDRPDLTLINEPTFVVLEDLEYVDRGSYSTPSKKFKGLTVHYTVGNRTSKSGRSTVEHLKGRGFGCMVMDENGIIYIPKNFDVFKNWGYHSGVSKWKGIKNVSDYFAGMEICCWGKDSKVGPYRSVKASDGYIVSGNYQQFTEAQEKSLINFILWAKSKNSEFDLDYVAGHDELRKEAGKLGDKQDPGGSLSMTMPAFRTMIKKKALELGI
jgi:N-acetyl-anhydromuramyl-L-alanine amidase AmpD